MRKDGIGGLKDRYGFGLGIVIHLVEVLGWKSGG